MPKSSSIRFRDQSTKYWRDANEMHEVLHSLPGYFKAFLLELMDKPMTRKELHESMNQLEMRMSGHHRKDFENADLNKDMYFAILCQAVDSRNHFLTSMLVCVGIIFSYLAGTFHANWLYYADALAALVIGFLIFKSSFELTIEYFKPESETTRVSHFVEKARENMKMKILFHWLSEQLKESSLTYEELKERFQKQFIEQTPKIIALTVIGYQPKSCQELQQSLDKFIEKKKLMFSDNGYSWEVDSGGQI